MLWIGLLTRTQSSGTSEDIQVVGRNLYRDPNLKMPDVSVHEYDEKVAQQMRDKLTRLRQHRDNEKASNALNALKEACKRGGNVMDYTLECARADCTQGEMRRVFTEAFGTWKSPIYV